MQIDWRNTGAEDLKRTDDSTPRAEINYQLFIPRRCSTSLRDRNERVNPEILSPVMKSLPRPINQQYVSLDHRARESEQQSRGDRQYNGKINISSLMPANDLRKIFVDIKEERRRHVRRTKKQQQRPRPRITKHRPLKPRAQKKERHRQPRAQ